MLRTESWTQGIARIRCPECGYDLFRPFSCKSFFLYPPCAQKRTLLLGEYLSEDLLFDILSAYFSQAAGRRIRTAMVSSHQSFGEFAEWHPHWHTIVLEGGFDCHDRFFFIPIGASEALSEVWRRTVIGLFLEKGLLRRAWH